MLYVGKAHDLKKRVSSYFQKTAQSPRIALMLPQVATVETTATRSEAEALILENTLIKTLAPRYNILFRDDKSYPYLMLTGATLIRAWASIAARSTASSRYFGPFPHAGAVRESIQLLQKIFLLRTCEDTVFAHRSRPCLLHQIQRCTAPCVGLIDSDSYAADATHAELFLHGRRRRRAAGLERQDAGGCRSCSASRRPRSSATRSRRWQTYCSRQYAESSTGGDADVIACAERRRRSLRQSGDGARRPHLGDRAFSRTTREGGTAAEVLQAFLAQHYLNRQVPAVIVAGAEFDAQETEAVLAEQSGHAVQIVVRAQGQRRAWLEMAQKNAELALAQRLSHASNQEVRLVRLARGPGPAGHGAAHRVLRHQPHPGRGDGRLLRRLRRWRPCSKSEYRRFNIAGIQPATTTPRCARRCRGATKRCRAGRAWRRT